jgi:hypothetical protein
MASVGAGSEQVAETRMSEDFLTSAAEAALILCCFWHS